MRHFIYWWILRQFNSTQLKIIELPGKEQQNVGDRKVDCRYLLLMGIRRDIIAQQKLWFPFDTKSQLQSIIIASVQRNRDYVLEQSRASVRKKQKKQIDLQWKWAENVTPTYVFSSVFILGPICCKLPVSIFSISHDFNFFCNFKSCNDWRHLTIWWLVACRSNQAKQQTDDDDISRS